MNEKKIKSLLNQRIKNTEIIYQTIFGNSGIVQIIIKIFCPFFVHSM